MRTLLYHSGRFLVIESPSWGGIEIVDKRCRRAAYLEGELARSLRSSMADLASGNGDAENLERFLHQYQGLYTNPLNLH